MASRTARERASRRLEQIHRELDKDLTQSDHQSHYTVRLLQDLKDQEVLGQSSLTPNQVEAAVGRVVGLLGRVGELEFLLGRVRGRRLYRMADVLAGFVRRPWRLVSFVSGLRGALSRRPEPLPPAPVDVARVAAEMSPGKGVGVGVRPLAYPHLRVAHAGEVRSLQAYMPLMPLDSLDLAAELEMGIDFVLLEPGLDGSETDLISERADLLANARIPIVLWARDISHLDLVAAQAATLVVSDELEICARAEDRGLTVLQLLPAVDDTIHNPIGWNRQTPGTLLVIGDLIHPDDADMLEHLADRVHFHGPSDFPLAFPHHDPSVPTGRQQAATAKTHTAAYLTPHLAPTPTAYVQQVLELAATGTPIITPSDPTLTALLGPHHLTADNPNELQEHLDNLTNPNHRERHSVPLRRHIHTHHTRLHRLEELLHHLEIPTNPTPRITILLATRRPELIEHAIHNVTTQNWPNKELILLLHGTPNTEATKQATTTLPFPTQTITCPPDWTLGDCLNTGLHHATGTYITKMDDDDHYGPHHLTDLHIAHTYSNATASGKWGNFVYLASRQSTVDWRVDREERYVEHLPGATLLVSRLTADRYRFNRVRRSVDTTLWRRLRANHHRLYSTHRFGFIRQRGNDHTYQRGDEVFIAWSTGELRQGIDFDDAYR